MEQSQASKIFLSSAYFDDLMVRMAHHSTAIEGNSLTQGETKSVLIDGYIPRALELRELNEVLNYKNFTKQMLADLQQQRAITTDYIKEMHRLLCYEAIESLPGQFKKQPNMIIGADFVPSPPYRVPMDMENWVQNLAVQIKSACSVQEIVEAVCRQHFHFERIHPFADGNGRVGRALLVYSCLQQQIAPIVIPVSEKKRYINYLNTMNINGFTDFAFTLIEQEQERIKAFEYVSDRVLSIKCF